MQERNSKRLEARVGRADTGVKERIKPCRRFPLTEQRCLGFVSTTSSSAHAHYAYTHRQQAAKIWRELTSQQVLTTSTLPIDTALTTVAVRSPSPIPEPQPANLNVEYSNHPPCTLLLGHDNTPHSMPSLEDRARAKEFVELHDQVEVRGFARVHALWRR